MVAHLDFNIDNVVQTAKNMRAAPKQIDKAIMRTINWAGARGFTQVRKTLATQTGIRQADLTRSRGIRAIGAKPGRLEYQVVSRSKWTPLSYFNPVQRNRGVSARPWGKRRIFKGTFTATTPTGHLGVFVRVMGGRRVKRRKMGPEGRPVVYYSQLPIRALWGPSIAVELGKSPTPHTFRATVMQAAEKRWQHEVNVAMGIIAPRGKQPPKTLPD
jgi:hypothetical protein